MTPLARLVYVGTGLAPSSFLCPVLVSLPRPRFSAPSSFLCPVLVSLPRPRSCAAVLASVPPSSLLYPILVPLSSLLCRRPRSVATQILRGVYPERSEGSG